MKRARKIVERKIERGERKGDERMSERRQLRGGVE